MLIPLSEQLRLATRPYHSRLDQLPVLKKLLSPALTARQYETAMLYFYHCFSIWQPTLADAAKIVKPPAFAHIDNQLTALAAEVEHFEHKLTPALNVPRPIIPSFEAYLGYSYVLTGAQLGARFILKKLHKSELADYYAFNYYAQVSQNTIDIVEWKDQLDSLVNQGICRPQAVIESATLCFSQLITWFEQEPRVGVKLSSVLIPV